MNLFSKQVNKDACVDETTWAFSGIGGEASRRVHNKPGVTKEGQTIMLFDVGRCHPRAYCHWHSLVKKNDGFPMQGLNELYELLQQVKELTIGNPSAEIILTTKHQRKIYEKGTTHVTADIIFLEIK